MAGLGIGGLERKTPVLGPNTTNQCLKSAKERKSQTNNMAIDSRSFEIGLQCR